MSPSTIAIIGLLILFIFMFLKMPISFAMFLVGFLGILYLSPANAAFNVLSSNVWAEFSNYSMSVVPLYILMGEIVYRAGISKEIFEASYKWVGHFKGGMAATTILASAGFGSISGSNTATAATMGTIALPELKKYKYDETISTGTIAAGGTLGTIIPPSTVLIVIALLTQQSLSDLFIASIVPSFVLVGLMLLVIMYLFNRNPEHGPRGEKFTMKEKLKALWGVIPIFSLFVFVIAGLFFGWFSPTESGAYGAFGAMVITLMMRKLTWSIVKESLISTLKVSAMIMMLIVSAILYGRFLTMSRLSFAIQDFINTLQVSPLIILLIVLIIFVIGGAIMDSMGFLMISIPVFYPIIMSLGYDPVWFGIIICVITSMGAITPPIGVNVFVVQGLSPSTSMFKVFKGSSYFLLAYIVFLIIFIAFPELITFVL